MRRRAIFIVVVAAALAVMAAGVGCAANAPQTPATNTTSTAAPATDAALAEVRDIIEKQAYVSPGKSALDRATTVREALGLLKDRYAEYLDPEQARKLAADTSGSYGGIGVSLSPDAAGGIRVERVFAGSPAAAAGVRVGDIFESVDDTSTAAWTSDAIMALVRGPIGTTLKLTFRRDGVPVTLEVERRRVDVPTVEHRMLSSGIGYVRIIQLTDASAAGVRAALDDLASKGATRFVIDIRDNNGGLLENAADVTSLFVSGGVIYQLEKRGGARESVSATHGRAISGRVSLLVNRSTSSGGEVVAGALKDAKRATLVGERTYGDGSSQTISTLSNGGALRLTSGRILTPKGHEIDGVGIAPDIAVKMDPSLEASSKTDSQLQAAIKALLVR